MPVLIDQTGVAGGTESVVRDSDGHYYVVNFEADASKKIWIMSSRDNWGSQVILVGTGGIISTATYINQCRAAIYWEKLFLIFGHDQTSAVGLHISICTQLANWNQSSAWKQNNESTTGESSRSTLRPGSG
jgi:hypothetical protein